MQVDTADGVLGVHEELMRAARGVRRHSSYHDVVPVGLDAEWEPYARGQAATPVATMQIATRSRAWVLDMQALCRSVRKNRRDRPGAPPITIRASPPHSLALEPGTAGAARSPVPPGPAVVVGKPEFAVVWL